MKTIIDLQNVVGYPSDGIFQQSIDGSVISNLLSNYAEKVDNVLYTQFGNRTLYQQLEFSNALDIEKLELIRIYILSEMLANEYKWEHLIATTTATYNPTENYNMTESEKITDKKNENTNTTQTLVNGERKGENINTNAVTPFETNVFNDNTQQKENYTENSVTDTSTNNGAFTTNNSIEKELKRSGNIGVTTTQQMLESERKLADYSIVKEIAKSIASVISSNVFYNL